MRITAYDHGNCLLASRLVGAATSLGCEVFVVPKVEANGRDLTAHEYSKILEQLMPGDVRIVHEPNDTALWGPLCSQTSGGQCSLRVSTVGAGFAPPARTVSGGITALVRPSCQDLKPDDWLRLLGEVQDALLHDDLRLLSTRFFGNVDIQFVPALALVCQAWLVGHGHPVPSVPTDRESRSVPSIGREALPAESGEAERVWWNWAREMEADGVDTRIAEEWAALRTEVPVDAVRGLVAAILTESVTPKVVSDAYQSLHQALVGRSS